jgi:hypothetical protein
MLLIVCPSHMHVHTTTRDLANALRLHHTVVFQALGGVRARRKLHLPLACGPHSFPDLGSAIVPFEDARRAAAALGKKVRPHVHRALDSAAQRIYVACCALRQRIHHRSPAPVRAMLPQQR